jgi:hypothetical protein
MDKKPTITKQKASLALRKETLRQLDDSKLQGVAGGARLWKPGFADDTTTTYDDTTG